MLNFNTHSAGLYLVDNRFIRVGIAPKNSGQSLDRILYSDKIISRIRSLTEFSKGNSPKILLNNQYQGCQSIIHLTELYK